MFAMTGECRRPMSIHLIVDTIDNFNGFSSGFFAKGPFIFPSDQIYAYKI